MKAGENQRIQEALVSEGLYKICVMLEHLRSLGRYALDTRGFERIIRASLREIEITNNSTFQQITLIRAPDIFNCVDPNCPTIVVIPSTGRVTAAVFALEFVDSPQPVTLKLGTPDVLVLPHDSHADLIKHWLEASHFTKRMGQGPTQSDACETPGDVSKNFRG